MIVFFLFMQQSQGQIHDWCDPRTLSQLPSALGSRCQKSLTLLDEDRPAKAASVCQNIEG